MSRLEEDPEYQQKRRRWLEVYQPQDYREQRLLDQLIFNDWLLEHANQRLQQEQDDAAMRYRSSAERSFYRAFGAVEGLRKEAVRNWRMERARVERKTETEGREAAKQAAKQAKEAEKKVKSRNGLPVRDQWVEVSVTPEGKTVTELFPPNEELAQELAEDGQPETALLYRRFHFVNGVPPEYAWTTDSESTLQSGGMGTQRLTIADWRKLIEREAKEEGGHLLAFPNRPRPEARGGCDCTVCTNNRELIENGDWKV